MENKITTTNHEKYPDERELKSSDKIDAFVGAV